MDSAFNDMYSITGRSSIPPEQLIRTSLLQILFTIRSERQLMERLLDTCASMKSFKPQDGVDNDDNENFHGQTRSNETHESTTDADARLFRRVKAKNQSSVIWVIY